MYWPANLPWMQFKDALEGQPVAVIKIDGGEDVSRRAWLRCARCGQRITLAEHRIQQAGCHSHDFINPHGIRFRIGCFRDAPGCSREGSYTMEHTWFPGYAWCLALCSNCHSHLGWYYQGGGGHFAGLILERLRQEG